MVAVTLKVLPSVNVPVRAVAAPDSFPEMVNVAMQLLTRFKVPENKMEPSGFVTP